MSKIRGAKAVLRATAAMVLSLFVVLSTAAQTIRYIHTDGLGSVVLTTDKDRNIVERSEYEPYGSLLNRPLTDGPGYAGQVADAATGMSYMQQRYMDPQLGIFVSVDPVSTYDGPTGQFNRYRYANSNPYKFTDPDGRLVEYAFSNGATVKDGAAVLNHWLKSGTYSAEIRQISGSNETYTISFNRGGKFGYDEDTRTINIDVTSGLRVKSSGEIQSPALGGGHEVSHGAQHDRVGTKSFKESLVAPQSSSDKNGGMQIEVGISPEEARATRTESKAAKELGEPARRNYHDSAGPVRACSPTSNKEC